MLNLNHALWNQKDFGIPSHISHLTITQTLQKLEGVEWYLMSKLAVGHGLLIMDLDWTNTDFKKKDEPVAFSSSSLLDH